ncbi:MAG: hypothetical protein NC489_19065 [Ruminococcus flavefaciens]|nr:hypothetical protein [Ruminococcus flavefaciens]
MNTEEMLAELEGCRTAMHRLVDAQIDLVVESIQNGKPFPARDIILPLSAAPAQFKGSKPEAVIFPDGRRVEVTKWKTAVTAILQDCANTPPYGERLMAIRGKVLGRQRVILAATPERMDAPLEICPELFMEGKFDTESLLYVLTKRILDPVRYSYIGISIQLRKS